MSGAMVVKKMINSVESGVDDMLEGYVAHNPGVRLLEGHRVVVREDVEGYAREGKVAVVCGGGSGHEPAQAGYVGRGFLTACVVGAVFASPPPQEILPAIRAVAKHNTGGCLLSVANYTGDRLNFGLAFEKAKQEGIKIAMIVTGEDCALTGRDKTAGRRGLVGYIVINKIAGALAESGRSLDEIVDICTRAQRQMGTIGLSWSACSVPGSGPTFSLGSDEMELGLGAHGEAGVKRMKMTSAREAVKIMIDHMINPDNSTHLEVRAGDSVAVFINNLGGTTHFELNILVRETIIYLENMGVAVVRCYLGNFLTSQEMAGISIMLLHLNDVIIQSLESLGLHVDRMFNSPFKTSMEMAGTSITLLRLDDTLTQALDAPTDSPHWPRPLLPLGVKTRQTPPRMVLDYVEDTPSLRKETDVVVDKAYSCLLFDIVSHVCTRLIENEAYLNDLDKEGGDSDTGSTLARGAKAIVVQLGTMDHPGLPVDHPCSLALSLAKTAEIHMGGASGALHSLLLTSAASCLRSDVTPLSWSHALSTAIETIKKYGGATEGDRTMLDPLCAACRVLDDQLPRTSALDAFGHAVLAAEKSAQDTAKMRAHAGRASYVNPDLLTRPDPGAASVAIWLRAVHDKLR